MSLRSGALQSGKIIVLLTCEYVPLVVHFKHPLYPLNDITPDESGKSNKIYSYISYRENIFIYKLSAPKISHNSPTFEETPRRSIAHETSYCYTD